MPRPSASAFFLVCGVSAALIGGTVVACSSSDDLTTADPDAGSNLRRESGPVDPVEAGAPLDSGLPPPASCAKYCDLVTENCSGDNAQYGSRDECLAVCGHLPLEQPVREPEAKTAASVACRQYWADNPSRTSPQAYCLAAGPFGGNACGDRCTAFCAIVLDACSPDGGSAPYASQPQCASACAEFSYRDAGTDGGGEGPSGPTTGNSLNCRLHHLRAAVFDQARCGDIGAESSVCTD